MVEKQSVAVFINIVFRQRKGEKHLYKNKKWCNVIVPLYCCDDYQVDSNGFILSKRNGKPMKPSINSNGYLSTTVMVNKKRKTIMIHLAVARSFLGDKTKLGLIVNHKDGNKLNNRLSNLEWVTQKENMIHSSHVLGHCIGSSSPRAKMIRGYDKNTGELKYAFNSIIECAKALCTNGKERQVQNCIWRALVGKRKTYKNCIWKYVN